MDRSEVSQQEMELEGGSVWTHTLFCGREFTQAVHTCLFLSLRVSSLIQSAETEAYKQDERREWVRDNENLYFKHKILHKWQAPLVFKVDFLLKKTTKNIFFIYKKNLKQSRSSN